jgi:hypothetical protein
MKRPIDDDNQKGKKYTICEYSCKYKRQIEKYIRLTEACDSQEYGVFCNGLECDNVTMGLETCGIPDDWTTCNKCEKNYCKTCSNKITKIDDESSRICLNCKPENEECI